MDEDTEAFNKIIEAFGLPKNSKRRKNTETKLFRNATRNAILVPFKVMETAFSGFELIREMVEKGNPNSVTDAGVGALALSSCIRGAFLNVKVNASALKDKVFVKEIFSKGSDIEKKAMMEEETILKIVESAISKRQLDESSDIP